MIEDKQEKEKVKAIYRTRDIEISGKIQEKMLYRFSNPFYTHLQTNFFLFYSPVQIFI